ncbi:MAG TPA: ABC transporter substrate-binding protein [Dongiaceae bacterium]|jgi:iron complex transport system substrate-binding protein|nr:ABC transporter substrate-binding protein [Dongiaceae bacterium]
MNRRQLLGAGTAAALLGALPRPLRAAMPERIVAAGGAMTEIVFALGEGERVVAVDTTSLYPWKAIEPLPKIGYLRQLAVEGILSIHPDLILADVDAGPKDVLDQLAHMGARVAHFTAEHTADSVVPKIGFVGAAIEQKPAADALAATFKADLAQIDAEVAKIAGHPTAIFLIGVGTTGLRGAGKGTAAAEMIARAGATNALGDVTGYKPASAEAMLAANPDYIVMMEQTVAELGGVNAVSMLPVLAGLDAAKQKRIVAMEGNYLLSFGPRTAHAVRDLAVALHPGADIPALPPRAWTA